MAPRKNVKHATVESVEKATEIGDVSPPKRRRAQKTEENTEKDQVVQKTARVTRKKQDPKVAEAVVDEGEEKRTKGKKNPQKKSSADAEIEDKFVPAKNTRAARKEGPKLTQRVYSDDDLDDESPSEQQDKKESIVSEKIITKAPSKRGKAKENGEVKTAKKSDKGKAKQSANIVDLQESEDQDNVSAAVQKTETNKPNKSTGKKIRGKKNTQTVTDEQELKDDTEESSKIKNTEKESANDEQSKTESVVPKKGKNMKKKKENTSEKKNEDIPEVIEENIPEKKTGRGQRKIPVSSNVKEDISAQKEVKSTRSRGKGVIKENVTAPVIKKTKKLQKGKKTTPADETGNKESSDFNTTVTYTSKKDVHSDSDLLKTENENEEEKLNTSDNSNFTSSTSQSVDDINQKEMDENNDIKQNRTNEIANKTFELNEEN